MIEKEILQKYYRVYAKIDLDAIENNIIEMKKNLGDRKSTRLNSSHWNKSRMPSSA